MFVKKEERITPSFINVNVKPISPFSFCYAKAMPWVANACHDHAKTMPWAAKAMP